MPPSGCELAPSRGMASKAGMARLAWHGMQHAAGAHHQQAQVLPGRGRHGRCRESGRQPNGLCGAGRVGRCGPGQLLGECRMHSAGLQVCFQAGQRQARGSRRQPLPSTGAGHLPARLSVAAGGEPCGSSGPGGTRRRPMAAAALRAMLWRLPPAGAPLLQGGAADVLPGRRLCAACGSLAGCGQGMAWPSTSGRQARWDGPPPSSVPNAPLASCQPRWLAAEPPSPGSQSKSRLPQGEASQLPRPGGSSESARLLGAAREGGPELPRGLPGGVWAAAGRPAGGRVPQRLAGRPGGGASSASAGPAGVALPPPAAMLLKGEPPSASPSSDASSSAALLQQPKPGRPEEASEASEVLLPLRERGASEGGSLKSLAAEAASAASSAALDGCASASGSMTLPPGSTAAISWAGRLPGEEGALSPLLPLLPLPPFTARGLPSPAAGACGGQGRQEDGEPWCT